MLVHISCTHSFLLDYSCVILYWVICINYGHTIYACPITLHNSFFALGHWPHNVCTAMNFILNSNLYTLYIGLDKIIMYDKYQGAFNYCILAQWISCLPTT